MNNCPYLTLRNGVKIPQLGFGVYQTKSGDETVNAVTTALEKGYRQIDTAMGYHNEKSVGDAIRLSNIPRNEIFLTTKVANNEVRAKTVRTAFEKSLEELQTDYLDLYLIHWPVDFRAEAWCVMEELYNEGKIKAIGVSNFHKSHLDELYKTATIKPMINQIESNPAFNNQQLITYCQNEGMVAQAWSPLGGNGTKLLTNDYLEQLAKKYNKCPAQIVIRWHLQRGIVPLPKSANNERIRANFEVFDFELTAEEMAGMNMLNKNTRSGADPDNFNF